MHMMVLVALFVFFLVSLSCDSNGGEGRQISSPRSVQKCISEGEATEASAV